MITRKTITHLLFLEHPVNGVNIGFLKFYALLYFPIGGLFFTCPLNIPGYNLYFKLILIPIGSYLNPDTQKDHNTFTFYLNTLLMG